MSACASPMDHESRNSESRERAASSEPCATRPNPFDDGENSRKRRRTSMNGASRSRSVDTVRSAKEDDEARSPSAAGSGPALEDCNMRVDTDPTTPTTPEGQPEPSLPPSSAPVSSRVTLNLRTSAQRPLDTIPSSPLSPQSPSPASQPARGDGVKISVEESEEVEMPSAEDTTATSVSSSSDAASPPVEAVNDRVEEDEEEEADYGKLHPQVTLLEGVQASLLQDPSGDFPYVSAVDQPSEVMAKLANYITSRKCPSFLITTSSGAIPAANEKQPADEDVSQSLKDWIDSYLFYCGSIPLHHALASYRQYRQYWSALPDLVWNSVGLRTPGFGTNDRGLRQSVLEFCKSYAKLTAYFVELDYKTLLQQHKAPEDIRVRDFASPGYLMTLASVTRRGGNREDEQARRADGRGVGEYEPDEITEILDCFQSSHRGHNGGALALLDRFMQLQIELMPRSPKIMDDFHHICCMVSNVVLEAGRKLQDPLLYRNEVGELTNRTALGHQFFQRASAALSVVIDRHVTCLSFDNASQQISSLGDIIQASLKADHPAATVMSHDYRQRNPTIAPEYTAEVYSMEWRFTMYRRLIMSSQMQLRVMAVSHLSQELVACWKRFGERPQDEHCIPVVLFFSEFLINTGLVPYLLGPTCHPEISVESGNIIGFLAVTKTYTNEQSDLMWQTITSTQDPRISDALLRMAGRIAGLYPYDALVYLCQKLLTLPIEAFGSSTREYCEAIIKQVSVKAKSEEVVMDMAPYEVCLRLLRESSVFGSRGPLAHPDVHNFAVEKLTDLLKVNGLEVDSRGDIYLSCLADLERKSRTTLGSLTAIYVMNRHHLGRDLQNLAAQHRLTPLLVDELEHAIQTGKAAGYPQVISSGASAPRRELVFNIVLNHPSTITSDLGPRLWNMLVGGAAACQEDRDAAWKILNSCLKRARLENPFLVTCFSEYLPNLPPECFCEGMLEFVRESVLPLVNDPNSIILDDEENVDRGGIELLWRIALTAPPQTVERQAINTLVSDIYIDSKSILSFSHHRARKVHLALVARCLQQLSAAAKKLKAFSDGTASGDDEPMVIVPDGPEAQEQELLFTRSLAVLREFLKLHRVKSHFAAPDLRSLISESPNDVEGESAELKFQSFDGDSQTEVKPLNIGKRNTAASLLASLKEATGFENYRIYYRGQAFVPHESDICKSLEDLRIQNGLILVKRESDSVSPPARIRPGASPVEIEILNHFEELWQYLSMEDRLAQEIYYFLIRLPIDDHILRAFQTGTTSYRDVFSVGHPYKSLYALHALRQYLSSCRQAAAPAQRVADQAAAPSDGMQYGDALARGMSLIIAAINDSEVTGCCESQELRIFLSTMLVDSFIYILKQRSQGDSRRDGLDATLLRRLLAILSGAMAATPASEASGRLIHLALDSILECCSASPDYWMAFQQQERVKELIRDLLLLDWRAPVRRLTAKLVGERILYGQSSAAVPVSEFREFFWPVVIGLIPDAIRLPDRCEDIFELSFTILQKMREDQSRALDLQSLLRDTSRLLLDYNTFEDITQPERVDRVAFGLARMLHSIVSTLDYSTDMQAVLPPKFAQKVFWKHLFPPWQDESQTSSPRVVLHSQTRMLLIQTILSLVEADPSQLPRLLEDLDALVPFDRSDDDEGHTPYLYELLQQFERSKAIRASCGYVGLRNLSNTCYLNSLLTQLFMNVAFRRFMLNVDIRDEDRSQSLLFQTRGLFAFLQQSVRRYVDPTAVVSSIRTYDDAPIDIHNQMDVDEFYNLLFDRWEGQLLSSETKRAFRAFYGGQLVQQVRSNECEHVSERLEPFSAIQCDIKGKNSLQESLQAYVDGEIMEGDNKYKCSTCDRHVDAVKRACLKDIPDHLIFHLKRFDFNLRTLQRNKINEYFSFPHKIDMRPYTIDQLSSPSETMSADVFELVGVLVHSGTAESGHYYSYIRERPTSRDLNTWVEFNDDMVSPWDPSHLENSCFGGQDYRNHFDGSGLAMEKSYSAYMLFYQRASSLEREQEALIKAGGRSPVQVDIPAEISSHIRSENTSLVRRHCLYDDAHIEFVIRVLGCVKAAAGGECSEEHQAEDLAMQMALSHLDQVASRAKDIPDFQSLLLRVQMLCQGCAKCCSALYAYFHERHEALRQLVQRNLEPHVRHESGNLLIRALRHIKEVFPEQYGVPAEDNMYSINRIESSEHLVLRGAVSMIQNLWEYFHSHLRSWHETFGLMLSFVAMGKHETAAFIDQDNFRKALLVISADSSMDLDPQFARLANTIQRRMATRPPSYENVISFIDAVLSVMYIRYAQRGEPYFFASQDRFGTVLRHPDSPLPMSQPEYIVLGTDWGRGYGNIFVDKLISINQNIPATENILARLLEIHQGMDSKIFTTLRASITQLNNGQFNTPFLRAALVYCRASTKPDSVQQLIRYVANQCRGLLNAEGRSFFEFMRDVFHGHGSGVRGDVDVQTLLRGLEILPVWAPGLLGYYDTIVSNEVEVFLRENLFAYGPSHQFEESEGGEFRSRATDKAAQSLGIECLNYIKDYIVARNVRVGSRLVAGLQRVIAECKRYYNSDDENEEDPIAAQFAALSQSVLEPLKRLIVDEIEEDASDQDWNGSDCSSEQMDSLGDISMQATGDLNDGDLQ